MVSEKVLAIIGEKLDMDPKSIPLHSSFKEMKVDSLYVVEILLSIEETFDITIEDASGLVDVQALIDFVDAEVSK